MKKTYSFQEFEDRIAQLWEKNEAFTPKVQETGEKTAPFVIVIPPPNVTGVLHMGHAFNNCVQDILTRYHRSWGRPSLWVPGTDHAGIATQQVVERQLQAEGTKRESIGREAFVQRTRQLAEQNRVKIIQQLKSLGMSCDWSRECFTLDEKRARAVQDIFVRLYEKGLIYRDEYLINWSVGAGTALSDDEVEYREVQGNLYWIRYPLEDGSGDLVVATTRPETMFGDTAVAVNPQDTRYTHLHGKMLLLPLTDKKIPVIADDHVDMSFGSGALKVTPAHAVQDYEIYKRHTIACVSTIDLDGTLNANVPRKYRGLSVREARKIVAGDLEEQSYLQKIEAHTHQVGYCYRSNTVIEPMLSTQWFVRMETMAQKALQALEGGEICFYPRHWENTYRRWMNSIRDWCISRQLWWGHRIPVWYDQDTQEIIVSQVDPRTLRENKGRRLIQDEDVLDTWFSSWLWPFSVFGWPEKTKDFQIFYPTSTLVTAYDIIFFWVARMVMAGIEFTGQVPFKDIFIHGLIRDRQGRKMSKSLGNGIDPLDIVRKYGADSLRFTLAYLCKLAGDVLIHEDSFQLGVRFANKVWNATRYFIINSQHDTLQEFRPREYSTAEKWILFSLANTHKMVRESMEQYRIDEAAHKIYEYFWSDFCDWYIEIHKIMLSRESTRSQIDNSFLFRIIEENLKLLHPFLPFISEELYGQINAVYGREKKILASQQIMRPFLDTFYGGNYGRSEERDADLEKNAALFSRLQELIRGIRTLRSEFSLKPALEISFHVETENEEMYSYLGNQEDIISHLTRAGSITISQKAAAKKGIGVAGPGFLCTVYIAQHISIAEEIIRVRKKREKNIQKKRKLENNLSNDHFLRKARQDYIERVRQEARECGMLELRLEKILEELLALQ